MSNFEFNGITKDYIRIAKGWKMPVLAEIQHKFVEAQGRPGGIITDTSTRIRDIRIPFILLANDFPTREAFEEDMARWLVTDVDAPLIFSKYPNRTYFARFEGTIELDNFHPMAQGTIEFVCSDPYKYQPEEEVNFVDGEATLHVPGTVDTPAIIELDVLEDITYVDVLNGTDYFRLGMPNTIEQPVYEPMTLVGSYPLTSLVGWSDATEVDNGYVTGTMQTTVNGFSAATFGGALTPTKFQGPAKRRSLPEAIQDFRVDLDVEIRNKNYQTGMIELYLKDASGNIVTKIGIEDVWPTLAKIQAKFAVGNIGSRPVDYRRSADNENFWNDFKGIIRVERKGNVFTPYFALVRPDGTHHARAVGFSYMDVAGAHLAPIVEVTIAIRKWPLTTETPMWARNLNVYRFNAPSDGVPIIAREGDKIIIDTRTSNVTINGEDAKFLKDFAAVFMRLQPGENRLLLEPFGSLSGKVSYRGRSL